MISVSLFVATELALVSLWATGMMKGGESARTVVVGVLDFGGYKERFEVRNTHPVLCADSSSEIQTLWWYNRGCCSSRRRD